MDIGVRAEENKRVDRGAELHAEGGEVARVEVERVGRCEVRQHTAVLGSDLGYGLFLDGEWNSGLGCDGLGFAERDRWYAAWVVD